MTATLTTSAAIIRARYPKGALPKAMYRRFKFIATAKKVEDSVGDPIIVALQTENPQGSGSTVSGAQASISPSTYNKFSVSTVDHFTLCRIKGSTLRKTESNEGALVRLWKNELDSSSATEMQNQEIYAFGNGSGTLGQISASATVASAVLLLRVPTDAAKFAIGQTLVGVSDNTLSPTVRAGTAVVSGVDRTTGSVTTAGGNWSTQITSLGTSDYLVRSTDQAIAGVAAVPTGLGAWLVGGSAPAALWGLTRTADPVRTASQVYDATGVTMEEAVQEACALIAQQGSPSPDQLWCHPRDVADFKKSLGTKVTYPRTTVNGTMAGVSFTGIQIEGDDGPVAVMTSPFITRNSAFLLNSEYLHFESTGPAPQLLNFDTNDMLRVSNDDAYESRFGAYSNWIVPMPSAHCRITNFGA